MKKTLCITATLLCCIISVLLISCKESDSTYDPYSNWKARNVAYYKAVADTARNAIKAAKTQYGDTWESHCKWRMYKNILLSPTSASTLTDSICVYIENAGTGSGCPLWTDSVRVNYRGMLMPTEDENGTTYQYVFDQSYYGAFNATTAYPSKFSPSGVVTGFGTALSYMHIGDIWRIYIPYNLGYGSTAQTKIPAYSTLIFTVNLVAYYRPGSVVPVWKVKSK
jgi:FKBP-type peptidyl-prolyl cis-trans isomerase FklB